MNINVLFAIIGGVFIGGAIGFLIAYYKHVQALVSKLGKRLLLHLGLCVCLVIGCSSMILSFEAKECPNCDVIVKSNYCEECGADIDDNSKFCGHCGFEAKE